MGTFFLVAWGLVIVLLIIVILFTRGTGSSPAPSVGAISALIWISWGGFASLIAILHTVYGLVVWIRG